MRGLAYPESLCSQVYLTDDWRCESSEQATGFKQWPQYCLRKTNLRRITFITDSKRTGHNVMSRSINMQKKQPRPNSIYCPCTILRFQKGSF